MRISLLVQQMPARLMPSAPLALASSMSSGSREASTSIAESVGSWPWTTTLTWSALSTPRLTSAATGEGVPKRMSLMSVESIEPPQPSARAAAQRGLEDVLGVEVDALVRAVQDLDDLAVDGARREAELLPQRLSLGRGAARVDDLAVRLAELRQGHVGDVEGDLVDVAAGRGHAHEGGHGHELLLVLDLVAVRLAGGDGAQRHRHVAAVVGVRRGAAGHLAGEVARRDGRQIGAAEAGLLLGVLAHEPARAHAADAAAGARLPDGAGLHRVRPREDRLHAAFVGVAQHLEGGRVDALRVSHAHLSRVSRRDQYLR